MRRKWTKEAHAFLYQSLTDKFGPYSTWENVYSPGNGRNAEYEAFKKAFELLIPALTGGDPVGSQIDYVIQASTKRELNWDSGRVRTAMLNLSAAYEAGFVGHKAFPQIIGESQAAIRARAERTASATIAALAEHENELPLPVEEEEDNRVVAQ